MTVINTRIKISLKILIILIKFLTLHTTLSVKQCSVYFTPM